jgi:hypothetical protein
MSILSSRDPEEAKTFYTAAFGWDSDAFATGDEELMLWRLLGYVGGEPRQPAPRDVGAVMVPTTATLQRTGALISGWTTPMRPRRRLRNLVPPSSFHLSLRRYRGTP